MKKSYLGAATLFQGLSLVFLLNLINTQVVMSETILVANALFSGGLQLLAVAAVTLAFWEGRDRSNLAREG